ncbi:MAG: phage baseplate plug family protein [Myxococcota bacterium]
MIQLPITQSSSHFSFATELDGRTWQFTFRWNHRAEQWVMSIADSEGNQVLTGLRVVIDFPLLARFRGREALPAGDIVARRTSGAKADPGFEDLGRSVQLYYLSADDLS